MNKLMYKYMKQRENSPKTQRDNQAEKNDINVASYI